MSTELYYFSGTGNSLAVAQKIAERLNEPARLIALAQYAAGQGAAISASAVGLVFPVYYHTAPEIVRAAIAAMHFETKPYLFTVVTYHGEPGNSVFAVGRLLAAGGQTLAAGFTIQMPGNAIVCPPEIQQERLANSAAKIAAIAAAVNNRETGLFEGTDIPDEIVLAEAQKHTLIAPEKFWVNQECSDCGVCRRVCPVHNITRRDDGQLQWGRCCVKCLACLHWCPRKAVQIGDLTAQMPQYHHPEIRLQDMIL